MGFLLEHLTSFDLICGLGYATVPLGPVLASCSAQQYRARSWGAPSSAAEILAARKPSRDGRHRQKGRWRESGVARAPAPWAGREEA